MHRFEALRASAAQHRQAGEPEAAMADLEAATARWHGEALAGIPGPFAQAQRARLTGLRVTVAEHHAELLLELGRHGEAVAELEPLCREHPLRERLQGLLIRGLHRVGRTIEAIDVFTAAYRNLVEASGLEPGPELHELHEQLQRTVMTRRVPDPVPPLPILHIGRESELALLRGAIADAGEGRGRVVWVEGEPGIGKSTLLAATLNPLPGEPRVCWATAGEPGARIVMLLMDEFPDVKERRGDVDQVCQLMAQRCEEGPLVLVGDNFQWADEASAPAVRVAEQLAAVGPAMAPWAAEWLRANAATVAAERPHLAIGLLRQVLGLGVPERVDQVGLSAMLARLLFWVGRQPDAEVRSVLTATTEPSLTAEMHWILGYVCYRRDEIDEALRHVITALSDEDIPETWRQRHESLLAMLSDELPIPRSWLARRWSPFSMGTPFPALLDQEALNAAGGPGPQLWWLAPFHALPADLHLVNAAYDFWAGNWTRVTAEPDTLTHDEHQRPSYILRADTNTGHNFVMAHGTAAAVAAHRASVVVSAAALEQMFTRCSYARGNARIGAGTTTEVPLSRTRDGRQLIPS
ncbi:BTAD domain-containing putative transcriptional regulator [Amycolatopsis sp.]|uniref:BTAD domain-containing putative transcriptional regulator n=1 Tax=Amycolatopsis sp. TaxID=37632 RepID=UPI002E009B76|nr:BTAD domain-containing putative transcriptional regulator [Amycolatopsis sp.]